MLIAVIPFERDIRSSASRVSQSIYHNGVYIYILLNGSKSSILYTVKTRNCEWRKTCLINLGDLVHIVFEYM